MIMSMTPIAASDFAPSSGFPATEVVSLISLKWFSEFKLSRYFVKKPNRATLMMRGRRRVVKKFTSREGLYVLGAIALFATAMILLFVLGYVHID